MEMSPNIDHLVENTLALGKVDLDLDIYLFKIVKLPSSGFKFYYINSFA